MVVEEEVVVPCSRNTRDYLYGEKSEEEYKERAASVNYINSRQACVCVLASCVYVPTLPDSECKGQVQWMALTACVSVTDREGERDRPRQRLSQRGSV